MAPLYRALTLGCIALGTLWPATAAGGAGEKRNLVVNGGFEIDDDNLHGEKMSCPVRPRVTYGQSDGIPDGWTYAARQAIRTRDSHSGAFALHVPAGKPVTLTPTVLPYVAQTKSQPALPPLHFVAWAKGGGAKDALTITLRLSIHENDPKNKKDQAIVVHTVARSFTIPPQWTKVGFDVSAEDIAAAIKGRKQPVGLVTAALTLQATGDGKGLILDDVELLCPENPAPYT